MNDLFNSLRSSFNTFGVGYDSIFRDLVELNKSISQTANYPPFNIQKVDDNKYIIEMAVAGFGKSNLDITLNDGILTISGKVESDYDEENPVNKYTYRGLAKRSFTRNFALTDTIEIRNADLMNGILKVFLENVIPDHKKPRKIPIGSQTEDKRLTEDATFQDQEAIPNTSREVA